MKESGNISLELTVQQYLRVLHQNNTQPGSGPDRFKYRFRLSGVQTPPRTMGKKVAKEERFA
jgi:hypothetical protein